MTLSRIVVSLFLVLVLTSIGGLAFVLVQSAVAAPDTLRARQYVETAEAFGGQKNLDSVRAYYDRALAVFRAVGDWKALAEGYKRLEYYTRNLSGHYNLARHFADSAVAVLAAHKALEPEDRAHHYYVDALNCDQQGLFPLAAEGYKRAIRLCDSLLSHRKNADIIRYRFSSAYYLSSIYKKIGDYSMALDSYRQLLAFAVEHYGADNYRVGYLYNALGKLYVKFRDYDNALTLFKRSLDLKRKTLGRQHRSVALALSSLGDVYHAQKHYDSALVLYRAALAIRKGVLEPDHPSIGTSFSDIGFVQIEMGRYENALQSLQSGEAIFTAFARNYPERPPHDHAPYNAQLLGIVYRYLGQHDVAFSYLHRALRQYRRIVGEYSQYTAEAYTDLAEAHRALKNYSQALYYYRKALRSAGERFSDTSTYAPPEKREGHKVPAVLETLSAKAGMLADIADSSGRPVFMLERALDHYELISDLIDEARSQFAFDGSKLDLIANFHSNYEAAITSAERLFRLTNDTVWLERAFHYAEKTKAVVLWESLQEAKVRAFSGISDSLVTRERRLRLELAALDYALQQAAGGEDSVASALRATMRERHFRLKAAYQEFIDSLKVQAAEYYHLKFNIATAGIGDVRATLLRNNATLLEYFAGDSLLYVFAISPSGFYVHSCARDSVLDAGIAALRSGLVDRSYSRYARNAHYVYQKLFAPVEHMLEGRNVIIVPDALLGHIPFGVLLSRPADLTVRDYSVLSYLIREYRFSYGNSATLLVDEALKREGGPAVMQLYGGFAPTF